MTYLLQIHGCQCPLLCGGELIVLSGENITIPAQYGRDLQLQWCAWLPTQVGRVIKQKISLRREGLRHKVGGLLNRKSVYPVMTADTEGFIVSTFYSLSLTFSCLNFPVVFSRWTSDFWRGNCSCSACIKNTLVLEYNLDYKVQELYVVFSNSN